MTAHVAQTSESEQQQTAAVSAESSMPLTVEVADSLAALESLRQDYEHLQRVTGNTLPFTSHEWHVAWCRQFLHIHQRIDTEMMIHVVRADGACVAVVPLMRTHRGIGPLQITSIDLLGADPGITEIRAPLIASGYEPRVAVAVQSSILSAARPHWVLWSGVTADFSAALASQARLRWQAPLLDYVLDLPPSWEELRRKLKRNIRESIRHGYNSLERKGFHPELRIACEPLELQPALERFLRLHSLRAARADTVKHRDVFASAATRNFLLEVCQQLAQRGGARIFELVIGGEVVAARMGFVTGKSLYLYYSGYDPAWSRCSVMTTTIVEAIKYAIASGLTTVNLSPGTDVSKTRWAPRAVLYPQAVQVFPSMTAHLAWETYRRARANESEPSSLMGLARLLKRTWG